MALQKLRSRINVKGGGLFMIRELSPTPSDTFLDVGFLTSVQFEDEHNMVEIIDDRGLTINYISGGESPKFTVVIKQSGIDEINILKNAERKYYEGYYKVLCETTLIQEINIPLFRFKPGPMLQFAAATERTLQLEGRALSVKAAMTRNPVGYNITIDSFFVIIENAAALGVPVDTASSVASTLL